MTAKRSLGRRRASRLGPRRIHRLAWGGATVVLLMAAAPAGADKLYKWEDENGVIHYADSVPAEDAKRERKVLNEQGVPVETLPRELSPEERAARLEALRQEALLQDEARRQAENDRVLLATYIDVSEIEAVRDRRVGTLEAQLRVNEHHLKRLRDRLLALEEEAKQYNYPFSPDSELPPLPDDLADEILDTANSLARRESDTENIRAEQVRLNTKFETDIARFRELKGSPVEQAAVED